MSGRLTASEFASLFSEGIEPEPAAAPAARRLRRQAVFRESTFLRARRLMRVVVRFIQQRRIADLPAALDLLLRERLARGLPDPKGALSSADGLAGRAFDLTPASMIEAYGRGLSPSACLGPVAWHCRARRFVARPAEIVRGFALRAERAASDCVVTFDRDIDSMLAASARPPDGSAIMPARLLSAFAELFDAGFAHSFEVRNSEGEAIGGGFGVAVGGVFVLEGAFETASGAAMLGLSQLARHLDGLRFTLIECAPGAAWLGGQIFAPMERGDYLALVASHMGDEKVGRWRNEFFAAPAPREPRRLAA